MNTAQKLKLLSNKRLPDGATFEARYDAQAVLWTVLLTIGEERFAARASSLVGATWYADKAYRKALAEKVVDAPTASG